MPVNAAAHRNVIPLKKIMGHTAFILGGIEGPYKDEEANRLNLEVLAALPDDDDWPWLDGSMFSSPARYHVGAVRSQLIHFGCSLKEDLSDEKPIWLDEWLDKLSTVLEQLTWHSAYVRVERDSGQTIEVFLKNKNEQIDISRRDTADSELRLKKY